MFLWYGGAEWLLCPGVIRCFFISMGTKNGFGSDSISYKPFDTIEMDEYIG